MIAKALPVSPSNKDVEPVVLYSVWYVSPDNGEHIKFDFDLTFREAQAQVATYKQREFHAYQAQQ